jgi:hypothetical protein
MVAGREREHDGCQSALDVDGAISGISGRFGRRVSPAWTGVFASRQSMT